MKCPECKFVSSNKRDVCPRCHQDLRPHKAALGLPITNPAASTDELCAKSKAEDSAKGVVRPAKAFERASESSSTSTDELKARLTKLLNTKITLDMLTQGKSQPETIIEETSEEMPTSVPTEMPAIAQQASIQNAAQSLSALQANDPAPGAQQAVSSPAGVPGAGFSAGMEAFTESPAMTPPPPPTEESPRELSELDSYASSIEGAISEAQDATTSLQENEFLSRIATPATSAVGAGEDAVEFTDEEGVFERQLDEMIGDLVLDQKQSPEPAEEEVEVRFEQEAPETPQSVADLAQVQDEPLFPNMGAAELPEQPAFGDDFLDGLVAAFEEIETETQEVGIAQAVEPAPQAAPQAAPQGGLDLSQIQERVTNALATKPTNQVVDELLELLGQACGDQQVAESAENAVDTLQQELDAQLSMLEDEGTTFLQTELEELTEEDFIEAKPEVQIPEPTTPGMHEGFEVATSDDMAQAAEQSEELDELQAELSSELDALEEGGMSFHAEMLGEEPLEEIVSPPEEEPTPEKAEESEPEEEEGYDEDLTELAAAVEELLEGHEEEEKEEDEDDDDEDEEWEGLGEDPDGIDFEALMESALESEPEIEAEPEPEPQAKPLEEATQTGAFLLADLETVLEASIEEEEEEQEEVVEEEPEPVEVAPIEEDSWEKDSEEDEIPQGERLEAAVNTGAFLLSDIEKIIEDSPEEEECEEITESLAARFKREALFMEPAKREDIIESARVCEEETPSGTEDQEEEEPLVLPQEEIIALDGAAAWKRASAAVCDVSFCLGLGLAIGVAALLPAELRYQLFDFSWPGFEPMLPYMFDLVGCIFLTGLAYSVLFTTAGGQTLGQSFMGLCVVDKEGKPLGIRRAALWASAQVTSALTFGVGSLPIFGAERRTLQEHLAEAVVVESE